MPNIELLFEHNPIKLDVEHEDLKKCGLYQLLPAEAKKFVEENRHVLVYLHMIPFDKCGTPKFYPVLSKKLKDLKHPNLIYPVNRDIAIHICPDKEDTRNFYILIESAIFTNLDRLMEEVERRIAWLVDKYEESKTLEGGEIHPRDVYRGDM